MTSEQLNQFLHEEDSPFRNLRPHRDFGWILKECPFGRQDFTLLVHIPINETRTMLRFYLNKFDAKAPRGPWLRDRYESWRQQTDIRRMFPGTMPNKLQHKPNRRQEGELLDIDFSRSDVEPFGRWLDDILKFADSISEQWIETGLQWNTQYRTKVMDWLGRICTNVPNDLLQPPAQNNHEPPMINKIKDLLLSNLNVILTGAPGTGKTFMAKEVAQKIITERLPDDAKQQAMNERFKSVQFHPGYDYADFVVGMKPVLLSGEGKELEMKNGKYVDVETGAEVAAGEISKAQVSFRWKDGIFKTFADAARNAYDAAEDKENAPRFVFLVDEINRADLSRVFGELFSLLEEEYRYPNGKDSDFVLLPNGERFSIPKNLYVIGTMNDIDRSVESMDFALRRRFAWLEVEAEESKCIIEAKKEKSGTKIVAKLEAAMDALNEFIRGEKELEFSEKNNRKKRKLSLGAEYELGGAYFSKFDGERDVDEAYKKLWDNHLKIILNEYLRGEKDKDDILDALYDVYLVACKVKQAT